MNDTLVVTKTNHEGVSYYLDVPGHGRVSATPLSGGGTGLVIDHIRADEGVADAMNTADHQYVTTAKTPSADQYLYATSKPNDWVKAPSEAEWATTVAWAKDPCSKELNHLVSAFPVVILIALVAGFIIGSSSFIIGARLWRSGLCRSFFAARHEIQRLRAENESLAGDLAQRGPMR